LGKYDYTWNCRGTYELSLGTRERKGLPKKTKRDMERKKQDEGDTGQTQDIRDRYRAGNLDKKQRIGKQGKIQTARKGGSKKRTG
jgi:hypothetical protein